ncbi:hypothetical protein TSUD_316890 [Trifolium subterraneum]|uniref:Uncharacterized protein n=1 Tax=Trifolium subterraneum TaxID=3900 RepID=A0A2Z6N6P8_TRISU|nr:hypothetical protein TSUD_316890 [Trifolium subterraneum]
MYFLSSVTIVTTAKLAGLCCTNKVRIQELHSQAERMDSSLFLPWEDMVMEGKEYKQKLALQTP